jgi:endonuclease/exonuclease/phosphatase family metal-dependent hydrolase
MLFFWTFRGRTIAIASLLTILLGWSYLKSSYGIHFLNFNSDNENQLKIMTYNIRRFRNEGKWDRNLYLKKIQTTLGIVATEKPDVACFQEFNYTRKGIEQKKIDEGLEALPQVVTGGSALVIASKHPIINSEQLVLSSAPDQISDGLFADIRLNNNLIVRVYSVHFQSNKVTIEAENMELTQEALQTKSTWKTIYRMFRSIKNQQKFRAEQVENLTKHIAGSPYPVIICGDFNDIPVSYTTQTVLRGLQDNFAEAGRGGATTYAGKIPFLKIDYIFSDKRFEVEKTQILKSHKESDHFPMVTTVSW